MKPPPPPGCQTPGMWISRAEPFPLLGLWDVFTQLTGMRLFGKGFANELVHVPNSMPNPVGTNYSVFLSCLFEAEFCVSTGYSAKRDWEGAKSIHPVGWGQSTQKSFLMDCGLREVCAQWHEQPVLQGTERDGWILLKIIFISISLQRIHVCSGNIHFEIWQTSLAAVGKFKQTHWEFSVTLTCCKHRHGLGACSAYHSAAAE